MYSLEFSEKAADFIRKLDKSIQKRITKKIEELKENPYLGEALVGNLAGLWKLRIGDYRITYKVERERLLIFIIKAGHRKNIYER